MVWGMVLVYVYVGLDLMGLSGGVVWIDDFEVVDIILVFLCDMMLMVDVWDFGVIGDGIMDDMVVF